MEGARLPFQAPVDTLLFMKHYLFYPQGVLCNASSKLQLLLICSVFIGAKDTQAGLCSDLKFQQLISAMEFGKLPFEKWLEMAAIVANEYMDRNISPQGTKPGAVLASPQGPGDGHANYRRVWVRDQALVMSSIVAELRDSATPADRRVKIRQQLNDFITFSRDLQNTVTRTGGVKNGENLGEALVNADGSMIHEGWGIPQWDGIAVRALAMIELAEHLSAQGEKGFVDAILNPKDGGHNVISTDLAAVCKSFKETSFDLWEEERGDHLDVLGKQAAALVAGARLAKESRESSAKVYEDTATEILSKIEKLEFWNGKYLEATRGVVHGLGKYSNLDVAVIFMVNHTHGNLTDYTATSERVQATAYALKHAFKNLYRVNKTNQDPGIGVLMGRYPEDTWNGFQRGGKGYGWVNATAAMAEFSFQAKINYRESGQIKVTEINQEYLTDILAAHGQGGTVLKPGDTISRSDARFEKVLQSLQSEGDAYLRRIQRHSHRDGSMNEGINGDTGYMQGPTDLTWNYGAMRTALRVRAKALL